MSDAHHDEPLMRRADLALLTDLYELTMADSYTRRAMDEPATFDLFARRLPPQRGFLISCGLEEALDYLEGLSFDDEALSYLRDTGLFSDAFLERLAGLRFTGDVMAIPEGELAFPDEPLVRVTAPLVEAQIVETFLLNCIGFQTLIASKAARVALACRDRSFVDFSPRRDHGADAALKAARAAYIGGASATSNVLAGKTYGLPLSGTMAHSYVMVFDSEIEAFRAFAEDFPDNAVLLIDTFDVEEGARRAAKVGLELQASGGKLRGVRIDSGDLVTLTRRVRDILDGEGLQDVSVVVSGDMDEYRISELLDAGAPIDAFGVGTQLGTSGDVPSLGCVYKLVADHRGPKIKLSSGKATLPGRKQVYRFDAGGVCERDVIALEDEEGLGGRPVLEPVMRSGRRLRPAAPLEAIRERAQESLRTLPDALRRLEVADAYRVELSPTLRELVEQMHHRAY